MCFIKAAGLAKILIILRLVAPALHCCLDGAGWWQARYPNIQIMLVWPLTGDQRLVRMGDMLPRLMASPTTHTFLQHAGQRGLVLEKIHRKNPLHHEAALCCVDYCPYSRTQRPVLIMSASPYIIICTKAPAPPTRLCLLQTCKRCWTVDDVKKLPECEYLI